MHRSRTAVPGRRTSTTAVRLVCWITTRRNLLRLCCAFQHFEALRTLSPRVWISTTTITQVRQFNLHCGVKVTVKAFHTRYRALGPQLIPVFIGSQPADDYKLIHPAVGCHYFPPGLRLPSQPQSITAPWPEPNYTAW